MFTAYTQEQLKVIVGHNIYALRHSADMTQSQLAAKINYSDKAVSKWECGDTLPDITILLQLANLFGVSLDYLVKEHPEAELVIAKAPHKTFSRVLIIFLSVLLVWLIATLTFVIVSPMIDCGYLIFLCAIPVSFLVAFILSWVWQFKVALYILVSCFIWTAIMVLYIFIHTFLPYTGDWKLFLLGIPLQVMLILWGLFEKNKTKLLQLLRKGDVTK